MKGSDYEAIGWTFFGLSLICSFFMIADGDSEAATGCCCWGFIALGIAQVGHDKKKKERRMALQTVYVQPTPVVIQQQPIYIPTPAPPAPVPEPPRKIPQEYWDSEQWAKKARNLELARDWDGAAQAYQKAGLYAEAGRVREAYLEKDEDKVVVNIDRVGDNVLHDSVMYNDDNNGGTN